MVDLEHPICPRCSGPLHRIGEDVAEPLDIEPAQFLVPIVRRPRYASPKRLRRHPLVERCRRRGDMARPVVAACKSARGSAPICTARAGYRAILSGYDVAPIHTQAAALGQTSVRRRRL
ncbi:hypothetical protein FFK22_001685 [Mycobacterium sp. KBS0706]|nr:hypothetical protein FFK22_001685 [Mycobacterium sp. KBS0706]